MLGGAILLSVAWPGSAALGQALERHLPPAEAPKAQGIPTPAEPGMINDDRALGASLTSLIVLGPTTPVVSGPSASGLDTGAVPRLKQKAPRALLARFLGRPISRKLISEIDTAIVKHYRAMGYPFVEVSTPEQEIDRGVLQIRVVEFRIGKIAVAGADRPAGPALAGPGPAN
jgi:hemolysin activation/secretion protein